MKHIWAIFFLFFSLSAYGREMVGKVVAVQGKAVAVFPEKKDRKLSSGSPVFSEETIMTSSSTKLQIRFTDGAILNLTPNSEYRVDAYSYGDKRKKDQYVATMIKGGFRHLTGGIAKNNPDDVEINTSVATMGVRGTVFEALLKDQSLFVGCEFGQIVVTTLDGKIFLGPESEYRFTTITTGQTTVPQGLSKKPKALENSVFSSPPNGIPTTPSGVVETGKITIGGSC
jgi:hypothetical protein